MRKNRWADAQTSGAESRFSQLTVTLFKLCFVHVKLFPLRSLALTFSHIQVC
jgi:hypothetical protein